MICAGVCSGISAPAVAWEPLGFQWAFESEIEPFPCAVLKHHRPDVPNYGDMNGFRDWPTTSLDVLIGGTPCQSFSVAGLRKGLADPRGNLALTYLALVDRYQPTWVVWENVPGVLSSGGGRDFGAFLGALAELGYGFAYRVLDAQWFGVAQRRRRVFVVGYLGDWRPAAAVLFERESLRGDLAPSREAREKVAPTLGDCANGGGANGPGRTVDSAESLIPVCMSSGQANAEIRTDGGAPSLTCLHEAPIIAHTLRGEGFDASEDGTGRGTPLVVVPDTMPTLRAGAPNGGAGHGARSGDSKDEYIIPVAFSSREDCESSTERFGALGSSSPQAQAVAFAQNTRDEVREMPYAGALAANSGMKQTSYIRQSMSVRRLTPTECERLQGFPDGYTAIPWRNKPAENCPDGPRYKALGNSMAVPVIRWIGQRIKEFTP